MKLFQAQFNSCIHESSFETISLHATPIDAQTAIDDHKAKEKRKRHNWPKKGQETDWDLFYAWRTKPITVDVTDHLHELQLLKEWWDDCKDKHGPGCQFSFAEIVNSLARKLA